MPKEYEKVDNDKFLTLIENAVETGDYSDPMLGNYVSSIAQIALKHQSFVGYTEDWRLEAYAAACLDMFLAMPKADMDARKIFNYMYTVARNKMGHVMESLNSDLDGGLEVKEENKGALEPFYVRNRKRMLQEKRRQTRGVFDMRKDEVFDYVRTYKLPDIKGMVGRACREWSAKLSYRKLEKLIKLSRKGKEILA